MSAPRLRDRDRRALLLGAAVLALGFGFRFAVAPYVRSVATLDEAVTLERELLARELALVGQARTASGRVDDLRDRLEARAPDLLPGSDELEAAGALSARVAAAADEAGLLLQRAEGRGSRALEGGVVASELLVQGLGDLEGVLRFLHALEGGPYLLNVERLSIQPSALRSGDPLEARPLELGVLVSGFRLERGEGPGTAEPETGP